jgi:regulator of protease activity HflC (stomatin/prohibitin superfamily)
MSERLNQSTAPAGPPRMPPRRPGSSPFPNWGLGWFGKLAAAALVTVVGYVLYLWEVRRVVVPQNSVLVLMKKNGSKSLPGNQVIVPRPPAVGSPQYDSWEREYGDCNGILEEVYPEGTYFNFSPFDYERKVIDISGTAQADEHPELVSHAIVPSGKVGVVIRKFGRTPLAPGQVLADPALDQPGPLPGVLRPGRYNEYANPYAYEIQQVDPLQIDPGYRGVVTVMAGKPPASTNQYLVAAGEQGVQKDLEPEGFRYVNPFEKRVTPISVLSQRFEMSGKDAIKFPSADSFDIQLEGFVEWSIDPEKLPLIYVEYAEGGELIPFLEEKVILPYARAFCRLSGRQYTARDFISGDTKLKFQAEFEQELHKSCLPEGILIKQALVRNIEPPLAIKQPINDREIAREQILQYDQQIKVAESQAQLATQEETTIQNTAIGEMNKQVITVTKAAEQKRDVALTEAQRDLAVATLKLEAAQQQADALVARGQADAAVILLKRKAEAEPLRQQVLAFGGGDAYARNFFYLKIAPSMKSILTNTDGPFADVFKQFAAPPAASKPTGDSKPATAVDAKTDVRP